MNQEQPSILAGSNLSRHASEVAKEYNSVGDVYAFGWHPRHIHFGVFESCETFSQDILQARGVDQATLHAAIVRMIEDVVSPAKIDSADTVVDAGCGIGGTALHLAKTRGCRVIGLNISDVQIEAGRKLARSDGLEHLVEFRFSDCANEILVPSQSIDVITNIETACHFADRGKFLAECARILKPGGRIVGQDWLADESLSAEGYQEFIQPICESWAMVSLDTRPGYFKKFGLAELEVIEFQDFGELVLPNAQIYHAVHRWMKGAAIFNMMPKDMLIWMERFGYLCRAWFPGHFQVHRYLARKPYG